MSLESETFLIIRKRRENIFLVDIGKLHSIFVEIQSNFIFATKERRE